MSTPQSHHYWSSLPVNLLVALFFFGIGLLIGWFLWRHCRERVERIRDENRLLREEYDELNDSMQESAA